MPLPNENAAASPQAAASAASAMPRPLLRVCDNACRPIARNSVTQYACTDSLPCASARMLPSQNTPSTTASKAAVWAGACAIARVPRQNTSSVASASTMPVTTCSHCPAANACSSSTRTALGRTSWWPLSGARMSCGNGACRKCARKRHASAYGTRGASSHIAATPATTYSSASARATRTVRCRRSPPPDDCITATASTAPAAPRSLLRR